MALRRNYSICDPDFDLKNGRSVVLIHSAINGARLLDVTQKAMGSRRRQLEFKHPLVNPNIWRKLTNERYSECYDSLYPILAMY